MLIKGNNKITELRTILQTESQNFFLLLPLFLWKSPNMYTLVWKHTNNWRNICTFQIPSAKKKSFNKWFKKNNYFEFNKFYICNIVSSKKYKSHKNYYYLSIL